MDFNKELKKIKSDGRSFLGIDGGNIRSPVWVCGIEFGGDLSQMEKYCKSTVKVKLIEGFDLSVPYRLDAGIFNGSPFDRRLAIFYNNLFKKGISKNCEYSKEIDEILNRELYHYKSKIFKLNIYPLGKKDTSWSKEITVETGITKSEYYQNLFENRKKFLKELLLKFEPKLLICTSSKEYRETFVEAFLDKGEMISYSWEYISNGKDNFRITQYKTNKTSLIVIPFLGRGNLNSYSDVVLMANHLKENYIDSLID